MANIAVVPAWLTPPADVNELLPQLWARTVGRDEAGALHVGGTAVGDLARLEAIQPVVQSPHRAQLGVRAALAHLAVVQDEDLVRTHDGAQPVRDRDRRPSRH